MEVAILICDCGDGSACLRWFRNIHLACALAEDESEEHEEFYQNEGSPVIIQVPDSFTPPGGFSDQHYQYFAE